MFLINPGIPGKGNFSKQASIIDINMGCPIKKIVNGNDGCSLMKNPELAMEIVTAVKEAVNVPVTCKFRLDWSQYSTGICTCQYILCIFIHYLSVFYEYYA